MTTEKLLDAIGMLDDELVSDAKEICSFKSAVKRASVFPLVAILIVLLSITAFAATGLLANILDFIKNETGGRLSPEQEVSIQEDTVSMGQAMIIDGLSITLNEVYGDGTTFWFYLSLDGPQIKDLDEIHFRKCDLVMDGDEEKRFANESRKTITLDDANPDDAHKDIIIKFSRYFRNSAMPYSPEMPQETMVGSLTITNIMDWENVDQTILEEQGIYEAAETVATGEWKFSFEIENGGSYQEMQVSGITMEGNAALNGVHMATAEIERITLRLLSMEMKYRTDLKNTTLDFAEKPIVVLEDGSEILLREKFGGCAVDGCYVTYTAEGPIMLDKVVAIRFGELVIPWQPSAQSEAEESAVANHFSWEEKVDPEDVVIEPLDEFHITLLDEAIR